MSLFTLDQVGLLLDTFLTSHPSDSDISGGAMIYLLSESGSTHLYLKILGETAINLSSGGEPGDITSVVAGLGLTGGATTGDATLNVIGGDGIIANADEIEVAVDETTIELSATNGSGIVRAKTAAVTNGATTLATGDQIYDFVTAQNYSTTSYVDAVASGLDIKDSCKVASTANLDLSGTETIDGISVSADNRVLVKDQSTPSENGIYLCKSGSWQRTADLATSSNAAGIFTFIEQGTIHGDNGFVCTSNTGSDTVGTHGLVFSQFSGAGHITAGNALSKTGNTLDVLVDGTTIEINADKLRIKDGAINSDKMDSTYLDTLQVKPSEGAFANGDKTKLNGIEASADVTDATNVAAAGAVMDTGNETIAGTKTFSSTITGSISGTATTLATARTINGVSFNGSASIKLPGTKSYKKSVNRTLSALVLSTSFLEIHTDLRIKYVATQANISCHLTTYRVRAYAKVMYYQLYDWCNDTYHGDSQYGFHYDNGSTQQPVHIVHPLHGLTVGTTYYFTFRFKASAYPAYMYRDKSAGMSSFYIVEHLTGGVNVGYGSSVNAGDTESCGTS